ncbi:MAG: hypothetical protein ACOX06_02955 [Candidatus Dojkabacteria bacterium]|jgi:hypothetical protein
MSQMYFSEIFNVSKESLEVYGAFNISLVVDLPLFIDPFLLFNSSKSEYQKLHAEILNYLKFLKDKSSPEISSGALKAWYVFSEVKQNWFGYSKAGNVGRGLAGDFARSLNENLHHVFTNFSEETITKSSHLEKLCLIKEGVGKDSISDFTTNLIKDYLLSYTEKYAKDNISTRMCKNVLVSRALFNYETESWETREYNLPFYNGDYVLLTPKDLLTKENTWINKEDLIKDFEEIPPTISNEELRAEINNYFIKELSKNSTRRGRIVAIQKSLIKYPEIIDYYIKIKEENGEDAVNISAKHVRDSQTLYIDNLSHLCDFLKEQTQFYSVVKSDSYTEALERTQYLKDAIEKNDCYKIFYSSEGEPIKKESDLQLIYRLVWFGSEYSVDGQVNNGRGSSDYLVSKGSRDKTVIEMKLASNPDLKPNLVKQAEIYAEANNTDKIIKMIVFFTEKEHMRVLKILKELNLSKAENIILIDARNDNKEPASKVKLID